MDLKRNIGRIIALDVGTKTIGVAVSDPSQTLARLECTLARKGLKADIPAIVALLDRHAAQKVVVGLPLELDGSEARSAQLARQVGEALRTLGRTVVYVDERFSSVEAQRQLIESGMNRKRRQAVIDQAAAAVILQAYLDHGSNVAERTADGS